MHRIHLRRTHTLAYHLYYPQTHHWQEEGTGDTDGDRGQMESTTSSPWEFEKSKEALKNDKDNEEAVIKRKECKVEEIGWLCKKRMAGLHIEKGEKKEEIVVYETERYYSSENKRIKMTCISVYSALLDFF